jgi:acyl dehydratase
MSLTYEDVEIGHSLAPIKKGPMTTSHIMRWSSAMENWHRIHYDWRFATQHDGLPDVLVNGSWKKHVLVQLLKDGLGPTGWLWKLRFRYKGMDIAGDTIFGRAEVAAKQRAGDFGFLTLSVDLHNQRDVVSTVGTAIGVVPLRGGPPVPYPFVPLPAYDGIRLPPED